MHTTTIRIKTHMIDYDLHHKQYESVLMDRFPVRENGLRSSTYNLGSYYSGLRFTNTKIKNIQALQSVKQYFGHMLHLHQHFAFP